MKIKNDPYKFGTLQMTWCLKQLLLQLHIGMQVKHNHQQCLLIQQ